MEHNGFKVFLQHVACTGHEGRVERTADLQGHAALGAQLFGQYAGALPPAVRQLITN